ncbi:MULTISPECIES: KpsF/GutQ family sugar-phosphate isomerase [unclassified Undibacterium]|uniref:KpsF/GutQ family sugar-phosphate isomerase n=1 Tax=unclassified Undibacterium TaxID=2630295 RepID=UPI002AC9340A|nr:MULTISPECIES: KpsF/GutQ family sugar-phosphate isomerase [unclassified Undibacterium]MEB0140962.1 KpsF/GutQ family sugar-phosphate isomerase [Undibacterium sp. CCC2.1]MEB0173972.1 KpsF/GutQ family sugar-phosphate isomerase [Undibacterium sp. CCC1.1]MEB0177906.1 KpsF/GutQ family sugar-phosphate isomerase [Undibacterium sp. CCC3.4]MEB0217150.1 KpsF/GutQ family sugar-phosphate isomerase [Undibacterium sp. 5I2]WPX44387.1 KpsF/GutQ family sugar-phosphate isomerase [Undibacterium sp. CCC3.4]
MTAFPASHFSAPSAPPADLSNSSNSADASSALRALQLASDTLQIEADAIIALKNRLNSSDAPGFAQAVRIALQCSGRVIVSGIGKSGHIAHKIAATFASTGTPAFFVHPAEAAHGDLGMIMREDAFIAISYSGETVELMAILPIIKRLGVKLIAFTGNPESSLARLADVHLSLQVDREACPLNLAPTASTTVTLALGDALAVAVLDARGFREEDFARSHPGGALGRRLLTHVKDVMRTGDAIPRVRPDTKLIVALLEITKKGMAMTAVVDEQDHIIGVFTDGDLRRMMESVRDFTQISIAEVMHKNPHSIRAEQLAVKAVEVMETYRINQLLVTDADDKLVGALHIHDLTRAKVI